MSIIKFETIENKLIKYREEFVIVDSHNPDKFPDGYVIALTKDELKTLQWKFSTTKFNMTRVPPKVFYIC
jgi:adenylate kinase